MVQEPCMNNQANAAFFALMMLTMSLAGCFGGDGNEQNDGNETPVETLDDWQVHFANAASDLPECTENRIGWLYYVSEDQNFRGCMSFGWELIDVTGPSGDDGADGTNGADGQDGADGTDGVSTLINAVNSTSCLNGGTTFEIGSDDNADGVLSVAEVKVTVDICNGAQGPEGPQGPAGVDGANGTDGQDGATGATGPQGPAGADGTNGTDGQDGVDGQDGADGAQGPQGQPVPMVLTD